MSHLNQFNLFLEGVDLSSYREQYRRIKIVELDMPKNVQALASIYKQYWQQKSNWPDYQDFYRVYKSSISVELEKWRRECQFSKETFYLGLPARIYRTWASLLTQIQGAYVAESIYGIGNVDMGVAIDHSGRDMVIDLGRGMGKLPIQIKKLTQRSEGRRIPNPKYKFIEVVYEVPASDPLKKDGEMRKPYKRWLDKWGHKLTRLDNGFIVFKKEAFDFQELLKGLVE